MRSIGCRFHPGRNIFSRSCPFSTILGHQFCSWSPKPVVINQLTRPGRHLHALLTTRLPVQLLHTARIRRVATTTVAEARLATAWAQPGSLRSHIANPLALGLAIVLVSAIAIAVGLRPASVAKRPSPGLESAVEDTPAAAQDMSVDIPPGRPGNLTPEQEEKLRQLWCRIFQVCAINSGEAGPKVVEPIEPVTTKDRKRSELGKPEKDKKKRRSLFSRKGKKEVDADADPSLSNSEPLVALKDHDEDKYGQNKLFLDTLASQPPESIRAAIWGMVKHDHPDALVLRFLRARKWDVDNALVMLVSTMNWRAKEMHVDDDIMKNGEAAAVEAERGSDSKAAKLGHDFLAQIRMGKSFLHGVDKAGRPICVVRVRLHRQGEQAEESLERYTVYIIETARMLLKPPVDTATIIFDMTGFSMANMDYTPVKFMIKCFEANYPESLGAVLVHKAPWIFQGIWKIIRGWLDPVVASKVHFTNNMKDMAEFIPGDRILKELDGQEDWEYQYVEPIPGENDTMKDTSTRDQLLEGRELLYKEFEEATLAWTEEHAGEQGPGRKNKRDEIAARLRDDYWRIDPYIRAKSLYDRTRVLGLGGKLDYYPVPDTTVEEKAALLNGTTETSADDVD